MEKYLDIPNRFVTAEDGTRFAYREYGKQGGVPLVCFVHLAANMDNWRPELLDLLAENYRIITFDYKGVGLSGGEQPLTIEQMAKDSLLLIKALKLEKINIFSLSMGGYVAQELVAIAPDMVDKLILTGTGIRGGRAVKDIRKIADKHTLRGVLTFKDPKFYMFFNQNSNGKQQATEFLHSLKARRDVKSKGISWKSYRRQIAAIEHWGKQPLADLSQIKQPTLVVNGDNDTIVPTEHSYTLAKEIPNAKLVIYPDAGHGAIFQEYEKFANEVIIFFNQSYKDESYTNRQTF
ncbi:MAG: alpha/beta hydrolase [Prevotellaceae bacterium]|nr:alpha/beta hydrolase [Prevotellaceae bacterium]MDY3365360.1 alpha/beta hydrolase [Prevotella sp.]